MQPEAAATTDESLIARIARERDRVAFEELFSRYARRAYSLASYLSGDSETAKEAVQDAMLDVWLKAETQRGANVRAWIMSIVAHHSLRQKRKNKMNTRQPAIVRETPECDEPAEQSELLVALRSLLQTLTSSDKKLVALHYGAGLTHDEIAAEISIPRSTVSFRLGKLVENLRGQLQKAGFASAGPLILTSDMMSKVLCTGAELSSSAKLQILNTVVHHGATGAPSAHAHRQISRHAKTNTSQTIAFAGAAGIAVLALALLLPRSPAAAKPGAPAAVPVVERASLPAKEADLAPPQTEIIYTDHFEKDKLNPFWRTVSDTRLVATGSSVETSLVLRAAGPMWKDAKGQGLPLTGYITSEPMAFNGRPLQLEINLKTITVLPEKERYECNIELATPQGDMIYKNRQLRTGDNAKLESLIEIGGIPSMGTAKAVSISPEGRKFIAIFYPNGDVAYKDGDGHVDILGHYNGNLSVATLTLRVAAERTAFLGWAINSITVKRLAP